MQLTSTFGSFLVAALTASLAAGRALPEPQATKGSFEVKRTANTKFTGRNGPLALQRAYNKYGIHVPESLIKAVKATNAANNQKRESGEVTTTPDNNDLEYLTEVQIGTPAQTFNLDFDSGSSDLWVFSTEYTGEGASDHTQYDPDSSSTSKKLSGETWKIKYGDGSSSSGDVYTDVVTIGDLTVKSQAVEAASQVSSEFAEGKPDGLLGLAFSSINTASPKKQKTWFDNIKANLDSPLFVADLRHDTPGSYYFGAIPSGASDVSYADVDNSEGFWQFSTTTSVSGSSIDAIADTGTTLLLTSDDIVDAYYSNVDSAKNDSNEGGYVFDCDADLPDFTFTVGDGEITVPGKLINYAPAQTSGTCFGGIQSVGDEPFSIFGDVALKAAYVIFDAGNTQVGFAQKD